MGVLPPSAATASEEIPQMPGADAQNTKAPGSPGGLSWRAEVDHVSRENKTFGVASDGGVQPSDYPTRPLIFGGTLGVSREQIASTSDRKCTLETEDGFRPSDYPTEPLFWLGLTHLKLNQRPQQQILEERTTIFRAERGMGKKSSISCVYIVEASDVAGVMAGRSG